MTEYDTMQRPTLVDKSKIKNPTVNIKIQGEDFKVQNGDSIEYQSVDIMDRAFAIVVFRDGKRVK